MKDDCEAEVKFCCGTTCNRKKVISEREKLLEKVRRLEAIIECLGYPPETD